MPSAVGKSPISDKLAKRGLGKATQAHASDETEYGSGGQVGPNKSGIGRLTFCGFGVYKTGDTVGESFLRVSISVVTPADEVGKQIMKMVPLCDTKSWDKKTTYTFDENVKEAMNLLRICGADTSNMRDEKDWEAVMKGLTEAAPHLQWHTWQGKASKEYPNPKIKEYIDRVVEHADDGSTVANAVVDNTGDTQEPSQESTDGSIDWMEIAQRIEGGETDLEPQLKEICEANSVDWENASTWSEGAEQVIAALGGGGSEGGSTETSEPWKPTKGEVLNFKLKGPGKAADWEVTAVFKETVNLKRKADGVVKTGLKWSDGPPTIDGVEL